MSQNINLFDPALRKPRRVLTLGVVAQCLGVLLAALFGYQHYLSQQVTGLAAELESAQGVLRSQQAYVQKLKGRTAASKGGGQLDADIARHEAELKAAREAMAALKGGTFGNQQGFAEYLRAFSRQSVNGLWLTGITIAGSGEMEIRGRALSADLVPSYIQRLNREQVLAGRSFGHLELVRPRPANAGRDQRVPAAAPPYLEFSLATTRSSAPEKKP